MRSNAKLRVGMRAPPMGQSKITKWLPSSRTFKQQQQQQSPKYTSKTNNTQQIPVLDPISRAAWQDSRLFICVFVSVRVSSGGRPTLAHFRARLLIISSDLARNQIRDVEKAAEAEEETEEAEETRAESLYLLIIAPVVEMTSGLMARRRVDVMKSDTCF